jgi:hypothetical protein
MSAARPRGAGRSRTAAASSPATSAEATGSPAPPAPWRPIASLPPVLEHQAEPRLYTFATWFAPGLTRWENPYVNGRTYVEIERDGDRRWQRCKAPINLWRALAAHVAAGALGEAISYREDGRVEITALGLASQRRDMARVLNLDLDGGVYAPAAVVAALAATLGPGSFLITSGAAGRAATACSCPSCRSRSASSATSPASCSPGWASRP